MNIKLGDFVSSKRSVSIESLEALSVGDPGRVVGFLLNSNNIEILVETLDSGFMDQYPAADFKDHWQPLQPPEVVTAH